MTLSGAYDRIRITGCRDVILDHVSAHRVDVSDSRVSMIAPRIAGSDVGLDVSRSDIVLTAGEIAGRTAILANGSRLDIAGTRLVGERAALRGVAGGATSELTLSVTPFSRGGRLHFLHTVRALAPGATL